MVNYCRTVFEVIHNRTICTIILRLHCNGYATSRTFVAVTIDATEVTAATVLRLLQHNHPPAPWRLVQRSPVLVPSWRVTMFPLTWSSGGPK